MAGPQVRLTWFDPRSGHYVEAGYFQTDAKIELMPPAAHDWGLILRTGYDKDA
jgi:collagenase-like protein with putative collagen-binding domain